MGWKGFFKDYGPGMVAVLGAVAAVGGSIAYSFAQLEGLRAEVSKEQELRKESERRLQELLAQERAARRELLAQERAARRELLAQERAARKEAVNDAVKARLFEIQNVQQQYAGHAARTHPSPG
jgi:tRNA A37 N6-isopentenylltransferase MiaA